MHGLVLLEVFFFLKNSSGRNHFCKKKKNSSVVHLCVVIGVSLAVQFVQVRGSTRLLDALGVLDDAPDPGLGQPELLVAADLGDGVLVHLGHRAGVEVGEHLPDDAAMAVLMKTDMNRETANWGQECSENQSPVHVSPLEYLGPVVVYEHPGQRQKLEEAAADHHGDDRDEELKSGSAVMVTFTGKFMERCGGKYLSLYTGTPQHSSWN